MNKNKQQNCQDQQREKVKKTKRINKQDPQPSAIHTHQLEPIPKMSPIVAPIRLSSPK